MMSDDVAARARVIGVAGGTGSGKTTIVGRLIGALGAGQVTCVEQDRYYRDLSEMPVDLRGERNFDHPDAFDLDLLIEHVDALGDRHGQCGIEQLHAGIRSGHRHSL